MKNRILDTLLCYNPNEYMPIFVDGKLSNKAAFAAYKSKQLVHSFSR